MSDLAFWHAPYPYRDFVQFSVRGGALDHRLGAVRTASATSGLSLHPLPDYGDIHNYVVVAGAPIAHRADGRFALLSGIARPDRAFLFGQSSLDSCDVDAADLGEGVGIFTLLHGDRTRLTLTQDFLGCGILYYYFSGAFAVTSNRYHLLLLFLNWIGHKVELDPTKVLSSLYSNSTFFHQNISSAMDVRGVVQLSQDHEIETDERGWRTVQKASVRRALLAGTGVDVRQLVRDGAAEILENVRAPYRAPYFDKLVTDLSGGMDSRTVLAAASNVDDAMARTEIRINDVPGSRDLELAVGITSLIGGRFYTERGRPQYPLTVDESLAIWRSYFMGTYHSFAATTWSPKGGNARELRLSGGCGEVYRTFWSKIYERAARAAKTPSDLAADLVRSCAEGELRSAPELSSVVDLVVDELDGLPGGSPSDRFESHYLFFRNRYHFGMRAFESYHDSPMWLPLMSTSLFAASRCLDPAERGNALILEVMERLHPLLVWIDFDSVATADNGILATMPLSDPRLRGYRVALDSDASAWEATQTRNRERLRQCRSEMDDSFGRDWRALPERLRADALESIEVLRSCLPGTPLWSAVFANLTRDLDHPRLVGRTYSKISSVREQLALVS